MKTKKGAGAGAGGHVEVGVKVIRPSMTTLQQLKEEARKKVSEVLEGILIASTKKRFDMCEKLINKNGVLDSAIEKAFAAGRDDRDDELWAACENTDTANFFSKLSAAAKEYKNL